MMIIGCDFHTRYQQIALMDEATGELVERRLEPGARPFGFKGRVRDFDLSCLKLFTHQRADLRAERNEPTNRLAAGRRLFLNFSVLQIRAHSVHSNQPRSKSR